VIAQVIVIVTNEDVKYHTCEQFAVVFANDQERRLHLGVGPEGRAATLDNAVSAREQFSLSSEDAGSVIARVWAVVREWKAHFEDFAVTPEQIEKTASALRHLDHIATPDLRRRLP
jgi:serine/threonine-protein kinase HipA